MLIPVLDLEEVVFHEKDDSPAAAYPAVARRNVNAVSGRRRISATDVFAQQLSEITPGDSGKNRLISLVG
jgi:hypothetical protein